MSSVSAHAVLLVILVRESIHIGIVRHSLMISRIEGNYLRHRRKNVLTSRDSKEMRRIVERCVVTADFNLGNNILIDNGAA